MTINASMFEVDASTSVLANNDLELVIPSVGTGANLHTLSHLACAAEHVHAKLRRVYWLSVVQAKNEQSAVDDVEAIAVVGTFVFAQNLAQTGPDFAVLGTQHSQSTFSCVL